MTWKTTQINLMELNTEIHKFVTLELNVMVPH